MQPTSKKVKMVYVDLGRVLTLTASQSEYYNFTIMMANEKFAKKVSILLREMKQFENLETLSKTNKNKNKKSLTDVISSVIIRGDITKENILIILEFLLKDYRRTSSTIKNFLISNNIEGVWY